jgi:large conductance mechanosensitive channel
MGFIKEFKEFAVTGNLLELASAVIIGGAVGAIIKSLVDDIVMPIIGTFIGGDFSNLSTVINGATIKYGMFIQNVSNFILIALVLFLMIKGANKLKKKQAKENAAAPAGPTQEELLTQIRDLLKK